MLVAFVLVLLPQLDDLLQNLDVEAFSLGLRKTSFFPSFSSWISVSNRSILSMNERMRLPGIAVRLDTLARF